MTITWITCPDCAWNYEQHGDTHMSTRFNCTRSRNTSQPKWPHDEPLTAYAGPVISLADADRQTEAVKKIMAEQGLNYGPAYDVYIHRQTMAKLPGLSKYRAHD